MLLAPRKRVPHPTSRGFRVRVAALIGLFAGLCLDGAHPAAAEIVLDQVFQGLSNGQANVGPVNRAQTFTVGIAGLLAEIDVSVFRAKENAGDLLFGIWPTVDGVPVEDESEALASIALSPDMVPTTATFVSFDVSSFGIEVEVDDVLAIVLRDPTGDGVGGGTYRWRTFLFSGGGPSIYPGGQLLCRLGNACSSQIWFEQPDLDANFRTYVDPLPFVDSDDDGVGDHADNCTLAPNPGQRDTNGDGYGNACDADLNDDGTTDFLDLGLMKSVFFSSDPDADLDGDGSVNFLDLGTMKSLLFQPPGPSAADVAATRP